MSRYWEGREVRETMPESETEPVLKYILGRKEDVEEEVIPG
jgi:hypothetical protein